MEWINKVCSLSLDRMYITKDNSFLVSEPKNKLYFIQINILNGNLQNLDCDSVYQGVPAVCVRKRTLS